MVTKAQLDEYLKAYQEGHPLISDEEYDVLLEEYLKEHPEEVRPFTRQKQSSNVNDAVGTLDKIYGIRKPMRPGQKTYVDNWFHKFGDCDITVQPKLDGTSIAIDMETKRLFTRGDYDNGESVDVTDVFMEHIPLIESYCKDFPGAKTIKFECIMEIHLFNERFAKRYKRARDAVAACITSRDKTMAHYISLVPLRVYTNNGIYLGIDHSIMVSDDFEGMERFIDELLKDNATCEMYCGICPYLQDPDCPDYEERYMVDGVVISKSIGDYVSPDDCSETCQIDPDCEVACKILNLTTKTTLRDIQWQFGKSGRITPVAIVDPVQIENVTITNIGLSTFERVVEMNLRYGDTVSIMYNIVPYFVGSDHDGGLPIPIPNKCPACGHPLNTHNLKLIQCVNPNCDGKRLGNIIRYCEKMGMFGVSEGVITKLWNHGIISCISDLYTKDLMTAANIDGLGERSMQNVIKSIHDASTNVQIYRWLGALPCNSVSAKKWKTVLFSVYGVNLDTMRKDVYALCHEPTPQKFLEKMLWNTTNTGPVTASSINSGIMDCWNDITKMIDFIQFNTDDEVTHNVVCMSGTRDADVKRLLMYHGFEVSDTWTKNCIALIVPDKTFNSKKVQQCREAGKPVYTLEDIRRGAL